jgi:hypothetical protein
MASRARSRLRAQQLQLKHEADDKRRKEAPQSSLASLLPPNAVRERASAERKKAKKLLLRLARNNANLVWDR